VLVAAVAVGPVLAQEPVYQLKVDVSLVSVDVSVFDAGNRPATGLGMEDFLVYEDGVLRPIRNFTPVAVPYNILLVFDLSASTQGKRDLMKQAVSGLLRNLRAQDRSAIAAFDERFEMLSGWKDGTTRALRAVDDLADSSSEQAGVTDLYRSIERAVTREFR